jgi:hypothetical protein
MTYSELLTLYSRTDGTSTTGDFALSSDIIRGTVTNFRLPAGAKAKIWCKRISGKPVEVIINYTKDVTASPITWTAVGRQVLASEGEITLEKQRPIIIRASTGKEAFKISWAQSTAGYSNIEFEVEITDE